ncbi:MAG: T9SS type A sorting domain-containing protein [Bacteroidia bacterium]|nr:T9SS type A sorting domain-containing protein [Bacteroidia bacterium]
MKKKITHYLILCFFILTAGVSKAQLNYLTAGYSNFSSTYVDLGTSGTAITMSNSDSGHSVVALPIGFTFNFNSATYDSFTMYVDGFIKLGSGLVSSDTNMNFTAYNQPPVGGPFNSTFAEDTSLIFPMGNDLWPCNISSTSLGTGTPSYRVSTTGVFGSRVCTIQWKNVSDKTITIVVQTNPAAPVNTQYDTINFQLKLFEGTNAIEFIYGRWVPSANTSQARFGAIGIKGNNSSTGARCLTVTKGSAVAWGSATANTQSSGSPLGNYTVNANNFGNNVITARPAPDIGRVYHFSPVVYNDAAVVEVRAMGKVAIPAYVPDPISAKITNPGLNTLTSLVVTLTVSGANTYSTTTTISSLSPGTSTIVTFPAYTPSNTGASLITVSVPADDNNTNNAYLYSLSVSNRNLGYTDTTRSFSGSNGSTVQIYASKYKIGATRMVTNVRFYIPANSAAVGVPVTGVVIDSNNNIVGSSAAYTLVSSNMGAYVTLAITNPPAFTSASFYAGISVGSSTATGTSFLNIFQSEGDGTATYPPRPEVSSIFPTGAGSAPTIQYNGRFMIECTIDPVPAIANNTISAAQSICNGSTPTALTGSIPTGGTGTYTYLWISSTTSATIAFDSASGTNNTQSYSPAALTTTTWFRRIVTSSIAKDTSAAVQITVSNTNAWIGNTSNNWNTAANWGCNRMPLFTDNVTINSGSLFMPVITNAFNEVNNLNIGTGGTLTINNAASYLTMYGTLTTTGTLTHTNGTIAFGASATQTVPANSYARIEVLNTSGVILNGSITITDSLKLTFGSLNLNGNNLTLNGTNAVISNASQVRYIKTSGTAGFLSIQNIGTGGRTGAITFPVGNITYNPVTLTNTGTSDQFNVRVIDSVTNTYSGSNPTGTKLSSNAVNRTWIINELLAGGSNATVTTQWNGTDELTGFSRSSCYLARYTGVFWSSAPTAAAAGANPYSRTRTGITSFSPFGVGSGAQLPVEILTFTGKKSGTNVNLEWMTASEINNDYFLVERSADAKLFVAVGNKIKGQGNSNTITVYTENDSYADAFSKQNNTTIIYYRLLQVDMDGTKSHSKTITVNFDNNSHILYGNVDPNPFTNELNVKLHSLIESATTIKLIDMTGKVLQYKNVDAISGDNEFKLSELDKLSTGVYFIIITQGDVKISYKVIRTN